jgi:clan AA aspartic protease (TIGR02281 family)
LSRYRLAARVRKALAAGIAIWVLVLDLGLARAGAFEEGLSFFEGGHYRWALEKFIEALDQSPRDPQRSWYLAESYRLVGDPAAAAHVYRQILRIAPQSPLGAASRQILDSLGEPSVTVVSIPIQRRGTSILVPARVNGTPVGVLILDTGATYTSLSSALARQLGVTTSGNSTVRLATANGVIQVPLAVLDEVDIGGAVAKHIPTVIHDLPGMPATIAGLLGMSFLERFRMNLDISSGVITLETGN